MKHHRSEIGPRSSWEEKDCPSETAIKCRRCKGTGWVQRVSYDGEVDPDVCPNCNGEGWYEMKKKLSKEDILKYATKDEKKILEVRNLYTKRGKGGAFELTINLDNEAFQDNPNEEIIHILKWLIQGLNNFDYQGTHMVIDSNGNHVGFVKYNS